MGSGVSFLTGPSSGSSCFVLWRAQDRVRQVPNNLTWGGEGGAKGFPYQLALRGWDRAGCVFSQSDFDTGWGVSPTNLTGGRGQGGAVLCHLSSYFVHKLMFSCITLHYLFFVAGYFGVVSKV